MQSNTCRHPLNNLKGFQEAGVPSDNGSIGPISSAECEQANAASTAWTVPVAGSHASNAPQQQETSKERDSNPQSHLQATRAVREGQPSEAPYAVQASRLTWPGPGTLEGMEDREATDASEAATSRLQADSGTSRQGSGEEGEADADVPGVRNVAMAQVLLSRGRVKQALELVEASQALQDGDPDALCIRGRCLEALNNYPGVRAPPHPPPASHSPSFTHISPLTDTYLCSGAGGPPSRPHAQKLPPLCAHINPTCVLPMYGTSRVNKGRLVPFGKRCSGRTVPCLTSLLGLLWSRPRAGAVPGRQCLPYGGEASCAVA